MNDSIPYRGRCGARTRAGGNCRRGPRGKSKRCHLHGGKSLRGRAHPRFKHGHYSKYTMEGMARANGLAVRRWERASQRASAYCQEKFNVWVKTHGGVMRCNLKRAEEAWWRWWDEFWEQEAAQGRPRPLLPSSPIARALTTPTSTPNWIEARPDPPDLNRGKSKTRVRAATATDAANCGRRE